MNVSLRPHWLLALALPFVLTACGHSESDQRAAFKQFLQTRILDKPGVHVPKPTDEEAKSFGDYDKHYTVITDFHDQMDASVKPLGDTVKQLSVRSLNDIVANRDTFKQAQTALQAMGDELTKHQAEADAEHAKLKQPEDLKAVYDQAYERTVTTPTTTLLGILPPVDAAMVSIQDVASYVDAHKDQIQMTGSQIQVQDPVVLEELNARLAALNAQGKTVQEAQARLQQVMLGK